MTEIAVLVLNWNGARWLEPCFSALLSQQGPPFDAWLIDNGSDDDSVALIRRRFPAVRVLELGANLGFGAAYNQAIAAVDAPLVALLNNDTVVQPGWLQSLAEALRSDPRVALVSSRVLFLGDPCIVNHAGGSLTVLGAAYDIGYGAPDGPEFDRPAPIGCASGAALLVRRQPFLAVGGFDERYFAFFDDADLCWRLWLNGYAVWYAPTARVLHAYGGTVGPERASPFRVSHCETNRLQNMFKHLESRTLLWAVPASLGYDVLQVLTMLRAGRNASAGALVHGLARFLRLLPSVLRERRRIQAARLRSDAELQRLGVLANLWNAAAEWRRLDRLSYIPAKVPARRMIEPPMRADGR